MIRKTSKRLAGLTMVILLAGFASTLSAADEVKSLSLPAALSQAKLLADLTDAERNALQAAAKLGHAKAGVRLIEQGQVIDKMYIILGGKGEILIDGKHLIFYTGQYLVGEIEFLDRLPASADVVLLEDTDYIELDNKALTDLMGKTPRLGYVLMSEIARIEGQRLRGKK